MPADMSRGEAVQASEHYAKAESTTDEEDSAVSIVSRTLTSSLSFAVVPIIFVPSSGATPIGALR